MKSKKLLIVEDDQNLGQILSEYLSLKGYESFLFRDGKEGLEAFKAQSYDCCLLDVMMPKMDGYTLAKEIRKIDKQIPFLFLTAKSMKEDRLNGFKLGAEDYITKPFSMEELLLRLNVIFRRGNRVEAEKLEVFELGNISFNTKNQTLSYNGATTKLTSKEAALLHLLCQNLDNTLDRRAALKIIWGDDSYFNARSMDVYIAKLRKHLKPEPSIEIITIHGQGFRMVQD